MVSFLVLICVFIIIGEVDDHLCKCMLRVWVSSSVNFLFTILPMFQLNCFSFPYGFSSIFIYSGCEPFVSFMQCLYFLPVYVMFSTLWCSFCETKVLNFNSISLSTYFVMSCIALFSLRTSILPKAMAIFSYSVCACSVHVWLCNAVDCSPPGSSVHGIFQAVILEGVTISSSRESSQPRNRTQVFCVSCRWSLYPCATWEARISL